MPSAQARPRLGSRGRPEETRSAILQAAVREFARGGIAGARTDAIARAAKVNKALLYYYYRDKDALYQAALDYVFLERNEFLLRVLAEKIPPGEKILRYVGAFFDYLADHPLQREMVQRELVARGAHMQRIVKLYMKPIYEELVKVLREGIAAGVFRAVDPLQFIPSMVAVIVHYFGSAPLVKVMTQEDPLSPERIAARRAAVLDFISAALFRPSALPLEGEQS
jgi:TetR/AcrR family transcriptional regulator